MIAQRALWMSVLLLSGAMLSVGFAQEEYRLDDGRWEKVAEPEPGTPAGELQQVRRLLAQDEPKKAREKATQWIERHGNHPLQVEAYLLRGDARAASGKLYEALYDYEYIVRVFPASEQFQTALERELQIAKLFAGGVKRKFLGMHILPAGEEAEEIFIRIQERAPGSAVGEQAMLELGEYYFSRANMSSAAEAYDLFLLNYPRSIYRERALLRLIQASLATFKGPQFDATGLIEAAQRIRQYQQEFPAAADRLGAEALLVRIEESLAQKLYYSGRWYDKRGKDVSAQYMYGRVAQDFPRTAAARAATERLEDLSPRPQIGQEGPTEEVEPALPPAVEPLPESLQVPGAPDPNKPTEEAPPATVPATDGVE